MAQCLKSQNESKHTSAVRTMTEACPGWRQVRLGSWMTQRLKTRGFQENTTTTTTEVVKTFGQWKQIARKIVFHSCPWKNSTLCCWLIWDLLLMFRNENERNGCTSSWTHNLHDVQPLCVRNYDSWTDDEVIESKHLVFRPRASRCQDPPCLRMYCKIFIWSRNVERSPVTKRGPCFSGQPWVPGTYVFAPQNSLWTKAPANKIPKQTFNE